MVGIKPYKFRQLLIIICQSKYVNGKNHFILSVTLDQFENLKSSRNHEIDGLKVREDPLPKDDDQVLVYIKDSNKVVAEFDIDTIQKAEKNVNLNLEPIYISPLQSGVRCNDLVLLQLSTFTSVDEWSSGLDAELLYINRDDFDFLATKLKS